MSQLQTQSERVTAKSSKNDVTSATIIPSEEKKIPFVDIVCRNGNLADPPPVMVQLRFNRNCEHEAEVLSTLVELQNVYNLNKKFLILFDATNVLHAERSHMNHLKKFLEINQEIADKNTVAVAIVLPTKTVKALMQAVLFFRKTPFEIKVFKKLDVAEAWMKGELKKFLGTQGK